MSKYRWNVTRDYLYERDLKSYLNGTRDVGFSSDIGVRGPRDYNPEINTNPQKWYAYDGDGELCYEGMIYGDYTGLEPLDDFCLPAAGCTVIKINGEYI